MRVDRLTDDAFLRILVASVAELSVPEQLLLARAAISVPFSGNKTTFYSSAFFILNNSAEVVTALRTEFGENPWLYRSLSMCTFYKNQCFLNASLASFRELSLRAVNRHSIIWRRFTRKFQSSTVNTGSHTVLFSFIVIHSLEGFSNGFRKRSHLMP